MPLPILPVIILSGLALVGAIDVVIVIGLCLAAWDKRQRDRYPDCFD